MTIVTREMNKHELDILERAFAAEIEAAVNKTSLPLYQTKSKLADSLVDRQFLKRATITLPGRFPVEVTGYALTEAGRLTYCFSDRCSGDEC